jgi:hypothetical protein
MNDDDDMNNDKTYGDSEFLARRDLTVGDFRESEKENKHKIIQKMLALRHNMKYNKHLLSVYMKAKGLFDTMVEEHRSQLHYLDEIYRHINQLIRENLSTSSKKPSAMIPELVKDKKRISTLLKRMRASYEKLTNVDTVVGVTIDKINEITFMAEAEAAEAEDEDSEAEDEDAEDEHEDHAEAEDEDEYNEASDADYDSEDDEDDDEDDDEEDDDEEDEDEDEEDDEDDDEEDEDEDEDEEDEDEDEDEEYEEEDKAEEDEEYEEEDKAEEEDEADTESEAPADDNDDDKVILLY